MRNDTKKILNMKKSKNTFKTIKIIVKAIIITLLVLIVLFYTLFYYSLLLRQLRNHFLPQEQPNSSWKSEDNTSCISIDDDHPYFGMIIIDGKMLELEVRGGPSEGGIICLYSTSLPEGKSDKQLYEIWDISVKGSKKFVATVEKSGLSADRVGKKITFHRIEYLSDMQKIKEILGDGFGDADRGLTGDGSKPLKKSPVIIGKKTLYYTLDDLHNEIEVFDDLGKHIGVLDPKTGDFIKKAVKGRKIKL